METQRREQLALPVETKEGWGGGGVFSTAGLEGPVGVYQAENRMKSVPDTRKVHSPFFIVYLEPKLSSTRQGSNVGVRSREPQVPILSQIRGSRRWW